MFRFQVCQDMVRVNHRIVDFEDRSFIIILFLKGVMET